MSSTAPDTRTEERAALHRVAGLLTAGIPLEELCAAGVQEMSSCVGAPTASIFRFDAPGTPTLLSSWGARLQPPPGQHDALRSVYRAGVSSRSAAQGPPRVLGADTASRKVCSWVLAPIVVGGRVWGAMCASSSTSTSPFPFDTESRMEGFADLLAVAVAHDRVRADLALLAEEQAVLRRLAVLVAHGASRDDVLNSIAAEAHGLFDVEFTALLRYDQAGAAFIVAHHDAPASLDVGERAPDVPDGLVMQVFRSGRPARVEAYADLTGPGVARMHRLGITAGAAAPILVDGRLWGVIAAMQRSGSVVAGLEDRLADFADIAATAVSAAQANADLRGMADQQAALREVAELAARNTPAEHVLAAVAAHASKLAGVEFTTILRFEPDGSTQISSLSGAPDGLTIGMRAPGSGDGATQRVWRTGRAARADKLDAMTGHWPRIAHGHGFASSAAVPISIQGRLWGALVVVGDAPLGPEIEASLASFAELAGTAISAAQARAELRTLVTEQAALHRVAELVARGAALDEVFTAVAAETSTMLGDMAAVLLRYDADDAATIVAACNSAAPLRLRVPTVPDATGELLRTGHAERVDHVTGTRLAELARTLGVGVGVGVGAAVAVPVVTEGRIWGALTISSPGPPLPDGAEEKLAQFADLAAAAIANAENKSQLTASRARVVATADETRRRLQRDVHDGAQQRLVQTIITLKLARASTIPPGPVANLIGEALYHAERANTELRDLVHGILPVSLSSGGLRVGLESLIGDLALPVHLHMTAPRLPPEIETTAYFFVAEALTNVTKHAHATNTHVAVELHDHTLSIEVRDNGVGGADPRHGTGLIGLSDRVEAANGTLTITSTTSGTTLCARLPTTGN